MSIDDSVLRDPRVDDLAELMGWSRRETLGALLDVWAICYDQVSAVVSAKHVDRAARQTGFCAAMIEAKLASGVAGDEASVRVSGVAKRIGYLESSAESGHKGGVKSGETRRRKAQAKAASKGQTKGRFDSDEGSLEGSANPLPLPSADPDPLPSVDPPARPTGPEQVKARQDAAALLWSEHDQARQTIAAELRVTLPAMHTMDKGRNELAERILDGAMVGERIDETIARCRHVIAVVAAECREAKSLKWFDGQIWRSDRFDRAASRPAPRKPALSVVRAEPDLRDFFPRREEEAG